MAVASCAYPNFRGDGPVLVVLPEGKLFKDPSRHQTAQQAQRIVLGHGGAAGALGELVMTVGFHLCVYVGGAQRCYARK